MISKKSVLLITEDKRRRFSKKVASATSNLSRNLVSEPATFHALEKVLSGRIALVIMSYEELGNVVLKFHSAVRKFHRDTPIMIVGQKKSYLDFIGTQIIEGEISRSKMQILIKNTLNLWEDFEKKQKQFYKRMDKVRHLTGDDLTKAIAKIREEIYNPIKFKKSKTWNLSRAKTKIGSQDQSLENNSRA